MMPFKIVRQPRRDLFDVIWIYFLGKLTCLMHTFAFLKEKFSLFFCSIAIVAGSKATSSLCRLENLDD